MPRKRRRRRTKARMTAGDVFADFKAIGSGADSALAAAEPIRQKFAGAGPATITHADIRAAGELTKLLTQFSDVYDRYKTATATAATSAGIVDQTRLDLISRRTGSRRHAAQDLGAPRCGNLADLGPAGSTGAPSRLHPHLTE